MKVVLDRDGKKWTATPFFYEPWIGGKYDDADTWGEMDGLRLELARLPWSRRPDADRPRGGARRRPAAPRTRRSFLADTNLPVGCLYLRRYPAHLRDAVAESGWGFSYTHPAELTWMRLDRVLLGQGLHAVSFQVRGRRVSAHRPVVADIVRR